ncbi:helix-turn-helix transcriptional regulator [Tardiphaga sp. P9-11]|uniref:helix-turn-helix domain-containing protein n=1 Tax=Tardiphaga sp. P9-11 TaxID=2024614 RepID=UPI001561EDF5|nr:helix-turn-helix transcriptional regulator [Tardiphaga sp. P9-11]
MSIKRDPARPQSPRDPQAIDTHIGKRVRDLRRDRRISQTELGNRIGVSFQLVQKYERGRNRFSAARLYEVCNVMGVSVATVFEGLDP